MRLAVFTSKYPARVATFFERDIRALLEAGVEVEVFSIYPLQEHMWRYRSDMLAERVFPRSRLHHIGLGESLRPARSWLVHGSRTFLRDVATISVAAARFGIVPLAKSAYVFPKAWAWAQQFPDNFDHILAYWGNYAGSCAYVFHRLTNPRIPFSIWLHAGTDLYRTPVFLREKLLYADTIITCCKFNRTFIEEQYSDVAQQLTHKIHVCYHGLDLAAFPYAPDGRPVHKVIAVGTFMRNKGFDYLLRAAHALRMRGVEVEVELVGDGDQAAALRAVAAELGIADRVRFRGWLEAHRVQEAMRNATILVHPSAGLGDGLPNVIREAMAVGTPVIASNVAGIPEALDHGQCGILVPPRDVTALADAIQRLLADEALRRRYAELGRKRTVELFDLWQTGARLAEHLRSIRRRPASADARHAAMVAGSDHVAEGTGGC
jgi:glycosyltransferase involved in cell wall biosynthesis